ncbi:PBP1b-binding outer membrane lipoprotein LpoB [Pedobacter sp. UYP30]|uniref:MmpS family transport accessory protein n=1 Tax=Pedobacter sp. UYP30 TaxID=1756400 RepID=UPI0033941945
MKKLALLVCSAILLAGCHSLKIYSMSVGKLHIAQKDSYEVVYEANFGSDLSASVAYTNSDGKLTKLKNIIGNWKKTITLKSGTHVQIKTLAEGDKSTANYKITVDGNSVNEKVLTSSRIRYDYSFDLP